jgi:hypothetical protein
LSSRPKLLLKESLHLRWHHKRRKLAGLKHPRLHRKRWEPHRHPRRTTAAITTTTLLKFALLTPILLFFTRLSSATSATFSSTSTATLSCSPEIHFLGDGFTRDTGANFNVWFFEGHSCFEGTASGSSVFSGDDPFLVCVG